MGWNSPLLTAPIGVGDLSSALNVASLDVGTIISTSSTIKAMAKYKAVRSSNPGILTEAERAATRYGFGTSLPQLDLSANEPQNDWVYQRPRGLATYNEWYRMLDFDGYASDACAPIAVGIVQLTYQDWSQVLVFVNALSNSIRTDGKRWIGGRSLSIEELLSGGSDYYGAYVAFIIVDTQTWEKNLVVTNKTFRALVNDNNGVFPLRAQQATDSGLVYPSIPILSSSRIGRTFRVIVCLTPGMQPQQGYAYAVYSSNVSSYTPYSVGFVSGADRASAVLANGAFVMDGTTMSAITITAVDMVTEMTYQGNVYRAFLINASATFSTANVHYSGEQKTIQGFLELSNSGGFIFGPTPGTGDNPIEFASAVSLDGSTAGQVRSIGTTGNDQYLWIMKYNGAIIPTTVTATVEYSDPFNTPLTGSGSGVIQ